MPTANATLADDVICIRENAWYGLGATMSILIGITLMFVGIGASGLTLGVSIGLVVAGAILIGGAFGSIPASSIQESRAAELTASDTKHILTQTVHGFHHKPKAAAPIDENKPPQPPTNTK